MIFILRYVRPKTLKELKGAFPDNVDALICELNKQKALFNFMFTQVYFFI